MAIIINGMDVPERCADCPLWNAEHEMCLHPGVPLDDNFCGENILDGCPIKRCEIKTVEPISKWTDYETELYEEMCVGCWREKQCHDDCTHCDIYLKRLAEMKKEELKPCPFCGSEELAIELNPIGNWSVSCLECGATGRDEVKRGRAIKVWNTRHNEPVTMCCDCRWYEDKTCRLHHITVRKGDYCASAWKKD